MPANDKPSTKPAEPTASAKRPAHGRLVLVRHGKPKTDKSKWINAKGYYSWWQDYELSGLEGDSLPPLSLCNLAAGSHIILSSTRKRAIETAMAIAETKTITKHEEFVEAALPSPPLPGFIRMRAPSWDIWSRLLWWLGMSRGEESRRQAEDRVYPAVDLLEKYESGGNNVLLCAHGWFNRMMRPVLQARGWDCIYDGRDDYWAYRIYEKKK